MQDRYSSLDSCTGLDDFEPDEVLVHHVGIEPLCAAPPTPLGMCYAPVPSHGRPSRAATSARASASPATSAPAPAPAESEGCLGVRQRACKRKVKYSDTEPPLGSASGGHDTLLPVRRVNG